MKKAATYIKNHIVEFWIAIALLLCVWAIGSIRLKLIPLIPTSFTNDVCDGWNEMYVNLSYSFIAGFIFYLLTTVLKDYYAKKKMRGVIWNKVKQVASPIEICINFFKEGSSIDGIQSIADLKAVLNSKDWSENIPLIDSLVELSKLSVQKDRSYISFCKDKCEISREKVIEMITMYKDYLSEEEIILLETYADNKFIAWAGIIKTMMPKDINSTEQKKRLVDEFCSMYILLLMVKAYVGGRMSATELSIMQEVMNGQKSV